MRRDKRPRGRRNVLSFASGSGAERRTRPAIRPLEVTATANRVVRSMVPCQAPEQVNPTRRGGGDTLRALTTAVTESRRRVIDATPSAPAGAISIAGLLETATGVAWPQFVSERIETWATRHFDDDGAGHKSPWHGRAAYAAWRGEAELDRSPEFLGVPAYCAIARTLPRDGDGMLLRAAHELRLDARSLEIYLQQLLPSVSGWAVRARRHSVAAAGDARCRDVLAIRAAWDVVLLDAFERKHGGLAADIGRALADEAAARDMMRSVDVGAARARTG